ncbi:hypothetical protein CPB86DRAFT_850604 [Serendipita vermifera]|nr:hypothetical protein CPB86DRAFT_850604 [Serendipita vermifera]
MRRSPKEQGSQAKYVVLGWYLIRDAWEEFEPVPTVYSDAARLFVRWKFAFEWIEAQGKPWWISDLEHATAQVAAPPTFDLQHVPTVNYGLHNLEDSDSPTHFRPSSPPKPNPPVNHGRPCYHCGKYSPLIYHEGWFCTNSSCSQFCLLPDSRLITFYTLSYSHDFVFKEASLEPRSVLDSGLNVHNVLEISTNPWTLMPKGREDLETFRKEHWQGRCCRKCGRLNSKIHWDVWLCAFCDVRNRHGWISALSHASDRTFSSLHLAKYTISKILMPPSRQLSRENTNLFERGHLYILRPAQLDLFDRMFSDFQDQANRRLIFRRSPLKNAYLQGQYTGHFIHNGGVHYNFSCQIGSEPLETGPPIVKEICELLAATSSRILNRTVEFNEVLSCAYKMDQSMNFHSDDEVGVQGVIASVSLGSAARMSFRRKTRKDEPNSGKNTVCLDLILRHGDILIMDGLEIQTNYQHRVVPTGLRFAATARTILHDGSIRSKRKWKRDSMKVPDVINC